jgi:amino acid transporter
MDAPSETSGLAGGAGLHRGTLDNGRVFGQSVAGVGPSLGAVALIPVAYASAGAGGWLTVVIGTLGVLAVAASVTIMARRNATAGALYHMNAHGLGRWAGFVTGVSLIALVTLILPFIALGFAQALSTFSDAVGIGAFSPGVVLVFELVCVVAGGACAYLDVKISTTLFLIVELVSMVLILAVLVVVLAHSPKIFDHAQLTLHGASVHGVLVGVVIIVLAFVGFEGATSLGLESRTPERAIPIALIGAVLAIGAFFTFNAYVQTLGFANLHLDITQEAAPLSALAQHYNVPALGDVVLLGVAASWFAALISWLVYGPRVVLTMAQENVLPIAFARTNKRHGSPYVAVTIWLAVCVIINLWVYVAGYNLTNMFAAFSSFVGYCAALYYLLAGAAVIAWAYRRRELSVTVVVVGVAAVAIMGISFYYSFVPLPPAPVRGFVFVFGGVVLGSFIAYGLLRRFAPGRVANIGTTSEDVMLGDDDVPALAVDRVEAAPLLDSRG